MSKQNENKQSAGWSCLSLIIIAAFLMTFGQALMGASWVWPAVFGIAMIVMIRKHSRENQK